MIRAECVGGIAGFGNAAAKLMSCGEVVFGLLAEQGQRLLELLLAASPKQLKALFESLREDGASGIPVMRPIH